METRKANGFVILDVTTNKRQSLDEITGFLYVAPNVKHTGDMYRTDSDNRIIWRDKNFITSYRTAIHGWETWDEELGRIAKVQIIAPSSFKGLAEETYESLFKGRPNLVKEDRKWYEVKKFEGGEFGVNTVGDLVKELSKMGGFHETGKGRGLDGNLELHGLTSEGVDVHAYGSPLIVDFVGRPPDNNNFYARFKRN